MKVFYSGLDPLTQQYLHAIGVCLCTDTAENATELLDLVSMENVDLLLVNLDETSWLETALPAIRSRGCAITIIGFGSCGFGERAHKRIAFLNAGGDDFFRIPFDHDELLASMSAALRRCAGWSSNMLEFSVPGALLKIHTQSRDITLNKIPLKSLTGTENAVLITLAEHSSEWCPKEHLIQKIYGINDEPTTNVVQVMICRIRKKLDDIFPGASKILQTERRLGYRLCSFA